MISIKVIPSLNMYAGIQMTKKWNPELGVEDNRTDINHRTL